MVQPIFILNESPDSLHAGDIGIHENLDGLLDYVEAIDVINGEHFAFTSDGRKITLSADHDYAPVSANIRTTASSDKHVELLLTEYLECLAEDDRFGLGQTDIDSAKSLQKLVKLISATIVKR